MSTFLQWSLQKERGKGYIVKSPPSHYKPKSFHQEDKVPKIKCTHDSREQGCYVVSLLNADIAKFL
jgi:hypothetical protein